MNRASALRSVRLAFGALLAAVLLAAGVRAEGDVPAHPAAVEPERAAFVVRRAEAKGRVADALVRLAIELEVETFERGRHVVALFPGDVAVADWSVDKPFWGGGEAFLQRNERTELVVTGKGTYKARIECVLRVEEERATRKVSLPIVPALVQKTVLAVPGEDLEFEADKTVGLETERRKGETVATLYGGRDSIALRWIPKVPDKVVEPLVFADQNMRVRIGQGVMRLDSRIEYAIVQGKVDTFRVRFPADLTLLNIEGEDIRSWDVSDAVGGAPRTLTVALRGEAERQYALDLHLEKALPDAAAEVELPAVVPLGVERERGLVAVSAARGLSVEAVSLQDASPVDVREVGAALRAAAPEDLRLGFRYLKRPFRLTLRTDEVKAKISAEVHTLARAGLESLRLSTALHYAIRDAGVFEFKVRLAEGLRLIDIVGENINNWQLDEETRVLTVRLRSRAEGTYRLEIESEARVEGEERVAVPALEAVGVDRESGYVAVVPAAGIKVETAELVGISQVDVRELPAELLQKSPLLAFRYIRPGYSVAVNVGEIEPEVGAEVRTVARLREHELSMDTEVHYDVRRAGVFQLRLAVPRELRRNVVEGADIDDTSWDEEAGVLTVNLRSKVTGAYVLRLETELKMDAARRAESEEEDALEVPVVRTLGVRKERGFVAVIPEPGIRIRPATGRMAGLDSVSPADLPPEMLRKLRAATTGAAAPLAFKYFAQPWQLALAVESIEPRITAEAFNLLSIGENLMTVATTINYEILHAGVDTFRLQLPRGATAVDIDGGDDIKQRDEEPQTGIWTVTLQARRTGDYALFVSFQVKLPEDSAQVPYPRVQALDVHRETGYVAITSRADIELTVRPESVSNLTAIDPREVPAHYLSGVVLPVVLAYRYVSHPFDLTVEAAAHRAAEVTVAVIETARMSTLVTEDGNMVTDFVCLLRNSRQQHMDLSLPPGARIWHAFVAGQAVTPFTAEGPDGPVTKLPVARAAGADAAFEVRLRYQQSLGGGKALGRLGRLRLESPVQDIDIMRLGWTLILPPGYDVVRDRGNIRRLGRGEGLVSELARLDPDAAFAVRTVEAPPSPGRGRGQAERQFDFNVRTQMPVQAAARGERAVQSIYTGAKPTEGRRFDFQGLIVRGTEPAWLEAEYVKGSVGLPLAGMTALLALLVVGAIVYALQDQQWAALGAVAVLALLGLAVRTLAEDAYAAYMATALYTLGVCAALLLLRNAAAYALPLFTRKAKAANAAVPTGAPDEESEDE